MKNQNIFVGVTFTLTLLLGEGLAFAHMRDYLVNQSYHTTRKGEFELELHNDLNLKEGDNDNTYSSQHQVEFEYGLTNRLQLAYYEVLKWDRPNDWQRDSFKIETKYRFLESGELPVDVALYGEYRNPNGHQDTGSDVVEGKLILSKDFGPWNVTGNLVAEREIDAHEDWQWEYTAGVSYSLSPKVRLGLELKEDLGDQGEFGIHRKAHKLQLVPGIYANVAPHVRLLFGPAIGLSHAADDLQLKSIVEIEF